MPVAAVTTGVAVATGVAVMVLAVIAVLLPGAAVTTPPFEQSILM